MMIIKPKEENWSNGDGRNWFDDLTILANLVVPRFDNVLKYHHHHRRRHSRRRYHDEKSDDYLQEGGEFWHELEDVSKVDEWKVDYCPKHHEQDRVEVFNLEKV